MQPTQDYTISYDGELYSANCTKCGQEVSSRHRWSVIRTLDNGHCKKCFEHYKKSDIPKNAGGKWISHCPKCGAEQSYTRPTHARASEKHGWVCRKCRDKSKSRPVGNERRLYNKYKKSAKIRGIPWKINLKEFIGDYNGICAMTGWELSMEYKQTTASLDRIDSNKGYEVGNLQWVHSMFNMTKGRYPHEDFVKMCIAVAEKAKKK